MFHLASSLMMPLRVHSALSPLLPLSECPSKSTLVLDLDETMVHFHREKPEVPAIALELLGGFLSVRPYANEFLSSLAAYYELVVWTAGEEAYGRAVVSVLDPSGSYISHSLYRQHCTYLCLDGHEFFIKDLDRLGRESIRILDNNPISYSFQPTKGIPVKDYRGDPQDSELLGLMRELTPTEDVDMVDVEPVLSSARRVRFGFVHVKMYCPNEPASTEDVEMLDADPLQGDEPEPDTVPKKREDPQESELLGLIRELTPTEDVDMDDIWPVPSSVEMLDADPLQEDEPEPITVPKKRTPRPRVSSSGPLRKSPRLARLYPRRSPRLAAKRLAAKL